MQKISNMLLIILIESNPIATRKLLIDFGFIHISFNERPVRKKNCTERVVLE